MSELTLVPRPHYAPKLNQELRIAACKEAREALVSLDTGTLMAAELSLDRAIRFVRFAQEMASIKES